jgi:hypothetical protein
MCDAGVSAGEHRRNLRESHRQYRCGAAGGDSNSHEPCADPVADREHGSERYCFPNIPIGTYTVTFEIAGFKKLVRESVVITAGFNAEINAKLEISTVQESVTVSGESPVVDTKSTQLGGNFNLKALQDIPTARDPWEIIQQTAGLTMTTENVGGNGSGQQPGFSAHGTDRQLWTMDGTTITDTSSNSSPTYYDFDSFEEMTINTGGGDASQQSGGITVNLITKSGSNVSRVRAASTSPTTRSSHRTSLRNCENRTQALETRYRTSRTLVSRSAVRSFGTAPGSGVRARATTSRWASSDS